MRGILCVFCNSHVDGCMHVSGRPYADYVNAPPAVSWTAYDPKSRRRRDRTLTQARMVALGYDPLYRNPTEQRALEPHRPAPAQAASIDSSHVTCDPLFSSANNWHRQRGGVYAAVWGGAASRGCTIPWRVRSQSTWPVAGWPG